MLSSEFRQVLQVGEEEVHDLGKVYLLLTSTLSLLDLSILQSKTLQLVLCFPSFTDFLYQTFKYIQGNLLISSLKSGKASQKS